MSPPLSIGLAKVVSTAPSPLAEDLFPGTSLPAHWTQRSGSLSVSGGYLHLNGDANGQPMVTRVKVPGAIFWEYTGYMSGGGGDNWCQVAPLWNTVGQAYGGDGMAFLIRGPGGVGGGPGSIQDQVIPGAPTVERSYGFHLVTPTQCDFYVNGIRVGGTTTVDYTAKPNTGLGAFNGCVWNVRRIRHYNALPYTTPSSYNALVQRDGAIAHYPFNREG